ncbi:lectin BRA-3 [Syngnathus scovelli]|uniref:lectin BRA-3 n=1 Tax=Syngnathus scovelli TaxID=161590 RepID=UPI0021109B60|nr:C-type lectin domain family 9 member A [Syngnathus scovelli]XP_049587743.1 C-type lectin domain family 9 member A [Syngnathus scovelli]
MEMQEKADSKKQRKEKAAMLEGEGGGNLYSLAEGPPTGEEVEPNDYTGLKKPSEDIYAAISEPTKQGQGAVRPYRLACLILTILCCLLLLVVIFLSVKTKNDACPENLDSWRPPTCSAKMCRTFMSRNQDQCYCCNQCPLGWFRLDQTCFFASTFRLSWEESQKNCSGEGGSLAVVSSQKVQTFLTEKVENLKYWIGLRRNGNVWTWVDNSTLRQSYWKDSQATEDCALLNGKDSTKNSWMKSSCNSYTYYICQIQL